MRLLPGGPPCVLAALQPVNSMPLMCSLFSPHVQGAALFSHAEACMGCIVIFQIYTLCLSA